MSRYVIFGSGGFGRELVAPARLYLGQRGRNDQIVFATDKPTDGPFDRDVFEINTSEIAEDDEVVIALGEPAQREQVHDRIGGKRGSLIAPTALIGPNVLLLSGAVICDYAMITASCSIGWQFQANIYSYVAHDCVVGNFVTLAPRASVNGNVHIGNNVYIGTGAVIKQGTKSNPITIGHGAVIGMGAVVTKSVAEGEVVVGNPAKPLSR